MAGLTGRQGAAAYAKSNTWGTAASVTQQIHIRSTEGLDGAPVYLDDEVFNQDFLGDAEIGDQQPRVVDLPAVLRYEDMDLLLAHAVGSPAAPSLISSQGDANSLVAATHVVDLATVLSQLFTLATAYGEADTHHVQEITTFKNRGFMIRTGEGGVMEVTFAIVGNRTTYDSTVNTNSTVYGATAAGITHRVLRKQGVFRMNVQGDGALGASDNISSLTGNIEFGTRRPVAEGDFVFNQDYIAEPDDDGVAEFPVNVTFPRMTSITANSLITHWQAAGKFKADLTFTGLYINSADQRALKFEWPNLQLYEYSAPISGHGLVRVDARFRGKMATTSPTGMAFVNPMRMTITNNNSVQL